MNDDLEYVRARIPGYAEYDSESARSESDMRVRAFVGERLADTRQRLGPLDATTDAALEALLLRCAFADQDFVKKIEHAVLDAPAIAGLVHADRSVIVLGELLETCRLGNLFELIGSIDAQLDSRSSGQPLGAN